MNINFERANLAGTEAHRIAEPVVEGADLDTVARWINHSLPKLAAYRGGSHVAVHFRDRDGGMVPGRIAIITE